MRQKLESLQGLRAIAALLVVANHAVSAVADRVAQAGADTDFAYFLGHFGVEIFFVISGFVMIAAHGEDFAQQGAPAGFLRKRLVRIVPLYWLMTLLYAGRLAMHGQSPAGWDVLRSLLFIPYVNPTGAWQPVFPLGWTLNFEMFFYLLFALGLFLPRRMGIGFICAGLLAFVSAAALCSSLPDAQHLLIVHLGDPIELFFLAGIAIALARQATARRLRLSFAAQLLCAGGLGASVCLLAYVARGGPLVEAAEALGSIAMFAICAFSGDAAPRGPAGAVISKLGDASYSIYLTHAFVVPLTMWLWLRVRDEGFPLYLLLVMVICAGVGIAVYEVVERPMLRALRPRPLLQPL